MSIRVYDFDFNLLAETQHAISREWDLAYNGIGSFEGGFDIYSDFAAVFAAGGPLLIEDEDLQAICVGSRIGEQLRVYGRTPEWLLSKRVVLPFKTKDIFGEAYTDPETIILYLLNAAYKNPHPIGEDGVEDTTTVLEDAVCENLIIPEPVGCEKLSRHFWRNSANTLSQVIIDLCDIIGCGHSLRFDVEQKCWRFLLKFGSERDLIISKSLKNAYDMSLTESMVDSAGGGYFEIYTEEDAQQTSYGYIGGAQKGLLRWDRVLGSASGLSQAESTLKKYSISQKVECELVNATQGVDYDLGDILRVQIEKGSFKRTIRRRVKGISIINNASGISVRPTLGEV